MSQDFNRYRRSVDNQSKFYCSYPPNTLNVSMESVVPNLSITRSKSVPSRYSSPAPDPPKFVLHQRHYPLPPPSFPDAMIAVSKRLRNRSRSPCPQYSEMRIADKPRIQSAALGHYAPTKYIIKSNLGCNITPDFQHYSNLPPLPPSSRRNPAKYY